MIFFKPFFGLNRTRLQQAAMLEQFLEAAPDAILLTDRQGMIVKVNQQAEQLFGYARAELLGQPIEMLIPRRFHSTHVGHRDRYAQSPHARPMGLDLDLWALHRDGHELPIEIGLAPLEHDGQRVTIAIVRDISARKRVQRELEEAARSFLELVQQVAQGKLDTRLPGTRSGMLHELEDGLNEMAAALQASAHAEQAARREAQRLQQQEAQSRQELERAVYQYLAFVQQVGRGDLTARVDVQADTPLGQLGQGLNTMVDGLHQLTSQLREAAANIAATAAEIQAATTQQAAASAEQAAALTQTTTTIEEVRAIAQQTAAQAAQVAGDSQSALAAAHQGIQVVEQTIGGIGAIREQTEEIAQTILALTERAQAIGTIVTTVAELADQSNLLALNAAIEAARAGEQGKSFAVVAQHVRDLAERSKLATTQVRTILGEIQQATHRAVLVTEEGTKGVEVGVGQASQAGQAIQRIVIEVEGGAQSNVQIASAAQQQMLGMDQIGQAVQSIQQATAQTLASMRQAERAATDLHALAQLLRTSVNAYQL